MAQILLLRLKTVNARTRHMQRQHVNRNRYLHLFNFSLNWMILSTLSTCPSSVVPTTATTPRIGIFDQLIHELFFPKR